MAVQKRFVTILSDFGFRRIFENRTNPDALKKFIQILINSPEPIEEISFDRTVKTPKYIEERGGVLDFYCMDKKGRDFIVEMQRTNLTTFIHRSKFYTYLHLNEMIEKGGEIKFNRLRQIYAISILDGVAFPDSDEFHQFICLRNQHGKLIDDQIIHVMLELGKWNKTEQEIVSELDIFILLMKFTDTATVDTPVPEILAKTEWSAWVLSQLEQDDLTRAERLYYRKQLAKMSLDKEREEDLIEAKQKLAEAEQVIVETKQEANEAKQEANEAKQKLITTVIRLLRKGVFTEEEIAEFIGIDIKQVQEIKEQMEF